MSSYKNRKFSLELRTDDKGNNEVLNEIKKFLKNKGYAFYNLKSETLFPY